MWLRKWFGRRNEADEYDEPTAGPTAARPSDAARTGVQRDKTEGSAPGNRPSVRTPGGAPDRQAARKSDAQASKAEDAPGVDPYNTGAFDRGNAWERVGRR